MHRSPLFILVLVLLAMFGTVVASVAAYATVRQLVIESPIDLPPPPQVNDSARPTATPPPAAASETTQAPSVEATSVGAATDAPSVAIGLRRFTVLLLGVDQRPGETGPFRTDTIIVLSFDPVRKTAAMLSIPRDVYIEIPGYKPDRINSANYLGDLDNYPGGGGPALAVKAVERLTGVRIDRYVLINFQAFNTVIDAIGSIEVCPAERIFDDTYPATEGYGFITVEFQPGCQALETTRLLQYARVRHNAGDDFGRAQRQQEVIRAVQKKVLSVGGVSALIGKAPEIWTALKDNIRTNLTYDEIMQLAQAAQGVTVKSGVLKISQNNNDGELLPGTLENGDQVLTPIYDKVSRTVLNLFDAGRGGPTNDKAQSEGAVLSVLNGAGVDGLARRTADGLIEQGFVIANVANADAPGSYGKTEIRVYTGKMATARYLAEVLGVDGTSIVEATDGPTGIDIVVIVGKDLAQ